MKTALFLLTAAIFVSCTISPKPNDTVLRPIVIKDSLSTVAPTNADTLAVFVQAIRDYQKIVQTKEKKHFDTLCFIENTEFPQNLELPAEIDGARILMVPMGNSFIYKGRSCEYLNMFGWINDVKGEFIFVQFKYGGDHQYDYFIDYAFDPKNKVFELEKIRFEDWRTKKKEILFESNP